MTHVYHVEQSENDRETQGDQYHRRPQRQTVDDLGRQDKLNVIGKSHANAPLNAKLFGFYTFGQNRVPVSGPIASSARTSPMTSNCPSLTLTMYIACMAW